jgi:hypothetical protein
MKDCGCRQHRHCMPRCNRRCIGTYTTKYKVYEDCCYSVYKVCNCCGDEYNYQKYPRCPRCGSMMDDPPGDPPRFGGFGRGGGFGRFGGFREFGGFRRFGFPFRRRFFPEFGFGFSPGFFPFEEEEEEFF